MDLVKLLRRAAGWLSKIFESLLLDDLGDERAVPVLLVSLGSRVFEEAPRIHLVPFIPALFNQIRLVSEHGIDGLGDAAVDPKLLFVKNFDGNSKDGCTNTLKDGLLVLSPLLHLHVPQDGGLQASDQAVEVRVLQDGSQAGPVRSADERDPPLGDRFRSMYLLDRADLVDDNDLGALLRLGHRAASFGA